MSELLRIEQICKRYGSHTALENVSFTVPRGSIYGLLGPNGAGKTSLIRIINRITMPDAGSVRMDGRPMCAEDIARIGYLPEERGLYKKMKVGEQAIYFARLKGLSRRDATDRLREWFDRLDIAAWWNKRVEELSKGMAQKVQFIVTVLHKPELLIFDEPFSGFDPINANLLKKEMLRLRDHGATIIFSTHNMASVEEVCDHITLISNARNILSGSLSEVRRNEGCNMYRVEVEEEPVGLFESLDRMCRVIERKCDGERHNYRVEIPQPNDVTEIIGTLNAHCRIRAFEEIVPTMNDIFLRAVKRQQTKQA